MPNTNERQRSCPSAAVRAGYGPAARWPAWRAMADGRAPRSPAVFLEGGAALAAGSWRFRARGAGRPEDVAPVTRPAGTAAAKERLWWQAARRVPRLFAPLDRSVGSAPGRAAGCRPPWNTDPFRPLLPGGGPGAGQGSACDDSLPDSPGDALRRPRHPSRGAKHRAYGEDRARGHDPRLPAHLRDAARRGGADIRYVQELLGHRSVQTTAIYTRVAIGDLRRVIARCHPRGGTHRERLIRG